MQKSLAVRRYSLGSIAGLQLTAAPSALAGALLMWGLLSAVGAGLLALPLGAALLGGLLATLLHLASDILHNLGHAWAARRTGHPMIGIHMWGVLASSVYPADEPPLPAMVHIRRALGGPLASLLLTLVAGALALLLRFGGAMPWWVAVFFFLDNLLVFTLQVFLPLSFNDGGTLWYWWPRR